jgi:hypothetical protein
MMSENFLFTAYKRVNCLIGINSQINLIISTGCVDKHKNEYSDECFTIDGTDDDDECCIDDDDDDDDDECCIDDNGECCIDDDDNDDNCGIDDNDDDECCTIFNVECIDNQ